jgi:hypothetical protein
MREIAEKLNTVFGPQGYTIPTAEAKYCFVKFMSFFMADVADIAKRWGKESSIDNTRGKQLLGKQLIGADQSLREMGESMINLGITEDKRETKQ